MSSSKNNNSYYDDIYVREKVICNNQIRSNEGEIKDINTRKLNVASRALIENVYICNHCCGTNFVVHEKSEFESAVTINNELIVCTCLNCGNALVVNGSTLVDGNLTVNGQVILNNLAICNSTDTSHVCINLNNRQLCKCFTIGPIGANGNIGSMGVTGIDGTTGPIGGTGNMGSTGDFGITGNDGDTGSTGATGATGDNGSIGNMGVTGSTGITGQQGQTGPTGITGVGTGIGGTYTASTSLQGITGIIAVSILSFGSALFTQNPPGPVCITGSFDLRWTQSGATGTAILQLDISVPIGTNVVAVNGSYASFEQASFSYLIVSVGPGPANNVRFIIKSDNGLVNPIREINVTYTLLYTFT